MAQNFDNSKLTNIVLNGNQNYIIWSKSVSIALGGRGKLSHDTGTKQKAKPVKPKLRQQKKSKESKNGKNPIYQLCPSLFK
jgi:gag-polypeptide of LTR copia-type